MDVLRVLDDVVVRQDEAGLVDDEAAARALGVLLIVRRLLLRLTPLVAARLLELRAEAEEIAERPRGTWRPSP